MLAKFIGNFPSIKQCSFASSYAISFTAKGEAALTHLTVMIFPRCAKRAHH